MDLSVSATPWPGSIRPYASPGLSTCLDERRLRFDGAPMPTSSLEVEALRLAEWAFARGEPLVLCPADPLAPLPALIAAAVHVADMAEHYRRTGRREGSSRRVAVVTHDYRLKGVYRGLGVCGAVGGTVAPLRDVVPAATLGGDGVVRVLAADSRVGWSTVFVPSVASLSGLRDLDLVVVVPPAARLEEVLSLGVPAVAVVGDPSDPGLSRVVERVPVYAWDGDDIRRAGTGGSLPPRLARRAAGADCEVVAVTAHPVCENAALFWQDVGPLARLSGRGGVARAVAREVFSLFHDLSALAVPVAVYEALTAPVSVRLEAVAAAARWTRGEARDLYLPMVEAELRGLAAALGSAPPKREILLQVLGGLIGEGADVMLIARTAAMARLHREELSQHGALARVRVTSLGMVPDEVPADVAVLTGMAPTRARWVYRCGIASTVRVLAYVPDGPVESVAQGYDEAEIVRRTVASQRSREVWLARPAVKDRTWSRLSGESRRVPDDHRPAPSPDSTSVAVWETPPPDVPPGLWDGDGWLADILPETPEEDRSGRDAVARTTGAVVPAVRVTFQDGRWALLDRGGMVTTVGAQPMTSVGSLAAGDRVVFFDGDGRKDLLAKVVEVAGEIPALAVAAAWVTHWRQVLGLAYRRFGTYSAFAAALAAQGCTVQTQTVRLWVTGVTIGPDDDRDVHRVGSVMGDAALRDQYTEVCRAIRSLRGAHVRLGRRLSEMARRVGPGAASGTLAGDEVLDERSGLTVADFRESVDVLTVREITPAGDVPYVLIGQLHDEDEMEEPA